MPLITLADLHNYLCDGTIHTFTIDTNIFYSFSFNFTQYPLDIIKHPHENIKFILPDIIYKEIEKNYIDKYNIQKAIKEFSKLISIDKLEDIYNQLKTIDIKNECIKKLDRFLHPKEDYIIKIDNLIMIDEIMNMYFRTQAPFENNKDKKCEFPDALALNALEKYALEKDINILAISDDNGWIKYCTYSHKLYAIDKPYDNQKERLLDCLQAFKNIDSNTTAIIDNIHNLITNSPDVHALLKNCIEEYLQNNIDCLSPYCDTSYQYDYEVDSIELINIDFNDPKLYLENIDNGKITIFSNLQATICGFVTFEEYIWDKEDNESILISRKSISEDKEVNFDITITAKIVEHDLNNIKIEECEVSPEDIEIDFGII